MPRIASCTIRYLQIAFITAFCTIAAAEIPTDPNDVTPIAVGEKVPSFTAYQVDGSPYQYDSASHDAGSVVIFYRGGWCPYCNTHLQDLRTVEPQLKEMGFEVIFLSTDRPAILHDSLQEGSQNLGYTLLSDSQMHGANAFRVTYRDADEKYQRRRDKFDIDIEKTQGHDRHLLPLPSIFIVDGDGLVQFSYSNPDIRVRLSADKVMAAAKAVTNKL